MVMQMKAEKNRAARFDISRWNSRTPVMAIMGPIAGLLYIIALPILGLAALILISAMRVRSWLPFGTKQRGRMIFGI